MAVQDTRIPYEILLRFDDDGALQGAHMIERRRVTLNGEVLKDEPEGAQPLTIGEGGTLWGVLDDAQVNALATATDLQDQLDAANVLLAEHQSARAVAEGLQAAAEQDRDAAIASRDSALAKIEAVQAALLES